jgi:hypothetical protein
MLVYALAATNIAGEMTPNLVTFQITELGNHDWKLLMARAKESMHSISK